MKPLPFRLRIALFSAAISGVVLAGFSTAAYSFIHRQKLESLDREIRSLGARHPGWFTQRGNYERLRASLEFIFGDGPERELLLLIMDREGRPLFRSPAWPAFLNAERLRDFPEAYRRGIDMPVSEVQPEPVPGSAPVPGGGRGRGRFGRGFGPGPGGPPEFEAVESFGFRTIRTEAGAWRVGALASEETLILAGLDCSAVDGEMERLRNWLLVILPGALFLVGAGGWVVAGRAILPLREMAASAELVTAKGLNQRISASQAAPEISRLVQVLNRMMDRLEASFRQATRFTADASHELKTPLAIMQGELENAVQSAVPGSAEQQVFSNLLEETQRLKDITRCLLLLAQADSGQMKLGLEPLDLGAELEELIEDARVLGGPAQLRFEVDLQPGVIVRADRSLLNTALMNLLSNAVYHNGPGGRVWIRLAVDRQTVRLEVGNTGPGIPEGQEEKIFDRFHRADTARTRTVSGSGLGLSLAREILRAHGGEVVLQSSAPGWTVFEVRLVRHGQDAV
jgi:heavy metal sensor kinase